MDTAKKRKEPDGASNEDPSSGDGAVPNWSAGLSQELRLKNRKKIAKAIHQNPYAEEIPVLTAYTRAKWAEEELYEQATGEHDYLRRISDYIQKIPHTPGILQAEPVDLTSQMGPLDNSQLISDGITIDAEDLPEEILKEARNDYIETVHPSLWELELQPPAELLPPQQQPQQQQPLEGFHSDGSSILPPQQQPQQQQGPNELQMEIDDEV